MKLVKMKIERLRAIELAEIEFNDYNCIVGANGAGKSTILCALNVFFRATENTGTDLTRLDQEDYFKLDTSRPIKITVTFGELSAEAKEDFKAYVRNNELTITASAEFNPETSKAEVKQYGQRLGMRQFAVYFEKAKRGTQVNELRMIYSSLKGIYPDLETATTKDRMAEALNAFEGAHPELCELIPSEDEFYGFSRGKDRLSKYIQWVYVPAVKDAASEQIESKNTALGQLLARAVTSRGSLFEKITTLREHVRQSYQSILSEHQPLLESVTASLQQKIAEWAHPGVRLEVRWQVNSSKSVKIDDPLAHILAGEGEFLGELARLGHGLQRSYILALLQELASSDDKTAPKLILGCEEPELYQHPPQARHLADVLRRLSESNAQILITTHSPYFVTGDSFESIRLMRRDRQHGNAKVFSASYGAVADIYSKGTGENLPKPEAMTAKIHQALQPALAEMFFSPKVVLVEGLEDVAYIISWLHLSGRWEDCRRLGISIIAANGKSEMLRPISIAKALDIPVFILFDSDSNETHPTKREKHRKDNTAILRLCGQQKIDPFPDSDYWGFNCVAWKTNMTETVQNEFTPEEWLQIKQRAEAMHGHAGGLGKNSLFIGSCLGQIWSSGKRPRCLEELATKIIEFGGISTAHAQ